MSEDLNIEKSWKTITLIPDYMAQVLSLSDFKNTLNDIVRFCELENESDKDILLYALYSYAVKAYRAKASDEFIIEKQEEIVSYFGELINYYNELTNSNYNELHKEIWYFSIYRSAVKDFEITEKVEKITSHELFDDCEIKHKSILLNLHIYILLNDENSNFDRLMELNEKLKEINLFVRRQNGEDI